MTRSSLQSGLRMFLVGVLLVWPTTGIAVPISAYALAVGAILAYEGVEGKSVLAGLLIMIAVESIYGYDFGILSLAYMLTALVFSVARRWATITPLAHEDNWSVMSIAVAVSAGTALTVVMGMWSAAVGTLVYSYGMFGSRVGEMLGHGGSVFSAGVWMTVILCVLHRIDVPFRRAIIFG
jgi:hypothetical protein